MSGPVGPDGTDGPDGAEGPGSTGGRADFDVREHGGLVGPTAQGRGREVSRASAALAGAAPAVHEYLRTLRRPHPLVWYGDLDPRSWRGAARSWRHFGLGTADARRAVRIVRTARRSGRVMATLPRSGSNWLHTTIASALSEVHGHGGGFRYAANRTLSGDGEWVVDGPRWVWSALPANLAVQLAADTWEGPDPEHLFLTSHEPIDRPVASPRDGRGILLVREPGPAIESYLRMHQVDRVNRDPRIRDARVAAMVRWFTTWSERLGAGADVMVLRYEDLRADPAAAVAAVVDRWDLGLSAAAIDAALARCTWEAMADKVPEGEEGTSRISIGEKSLTDEVRAEVARAASGLGTAFGY